MATLIIVVMLFTSAGFTLGNTGVEALFFGTLWGGIPAIHVHGARLLSFFVTWGSLPCSVASVNERLYMVCRLCWQLVLVGGWALLFTSLMPFTRPLWLGMAIIDSIDQSCSFWGLASMMCDTRQSKRLFPLFNPGASLALSGGFGTGYCQLDWHRELVIGHGRGHADCLCGWESARRSARQAGSPTPTHSSVSTRASSPRCKRIPICRSF